MPERHPKHLVTKAEPKKQNAATNSQRSSSQDKPHYFGLLLQARSLNGLLEQLEFQKKVVSPLLER